MHIITPKKNYEEHETYLALKTSDNHDNEINVIPEKTIWIIL